MPWAVAVMLAKARAEAQDIPKDSIPTVSSMDDAYTAQGFMIQQGLLGALKGWKVGAANPAAQTKLGIPEPFRGPIFANYVAESGTQIPWSRVGCVLSAVEVEFCFVMAKPLPPRDTPYTEDEVWGAVDYMTTAIEIAAQRSSALSPMSRETLYRSVADCAVNGFVVMGKPVPLTEVDREALPNLPATLTVTPQGSTEGKTALGAGDNVLPCGPKGGSAAVGPLASLTWLANHLATTHTGLQAGELVISGAAALLKKPDCDVGMACTVTAGVTFRPGGTPVEVSLVLQ
mmetsp:Transcript_52105/g.124120  ORF Transcript_52105/g.124120 Transcript_52105/m.124120 type:complete len:288 (-) Transcript_52105:220-1083(-)